jgi:hypothetical protein
MYRNILAFDFDGTLAIDGVVPQELQLALKQLQQLGYVLFLVTGRRFQSLNLGDLYDVFSGIAWENGAVLCPTINNEVFMPFGYVNPHLIHELEYAGIPLEYGMSIVATWRHHEKDVSRVLRRSGGDVGVIYNKGSIMILPAGATKGTGLRDLLKLCGYSPRNLVSFGDGENDASMLQMGEIGVAVGDAVPSLKLVADLVARHDGPAGTLEILTNYWLNGNPLDIPAKQERWISLGVDARTDLPVFLPNKVMVGSNVGIFGDSSSGKSWIAGLLAESIHLAGYQMVLIDIEGDFRGLQALPGVVAFSGDVDSMASPSTIAALLKESDVAIVIDLCAKPTEWINSYVADLLSVLHHIRSTWCRPHWIVLEEAQRLLSLPESPCLDAFIKLMESGGCTVVSYRPDRLAQPVLNNLDHCFLTHTSEPDVVETLVHRRDVVSAETLTDIPHSHVLYDGHQLIKLRPNARRVRHIRHLYKYLDMPLPRHKRFRFHDENGPLNVEAASLFEFKDLLRTLPIDTLVYHQRRGDFALWIRNALDDDELSTHFDQLGHASANLDNLRDILWRITAQRYEELNALRM